jgi:hypothetical protein
MSDTESNPEYPTLPVNLFDKPIKYKDLPEQSPTSLSTPKDFFATLLPIDKGKEKMAPGGSTSADVFSFSTSVDEKTPVNIKLDSIGKFTGQENYKI